ncbi:tetratricopeptide repeat protein [Flavobacterium sp. MAH-1]|uniref:Tetratricopeptide repeat protein n=1 Tax=Flavobacterium agri TaxID=2743471 RepID=A0A7Y8Y1R7_9FLAO|nr:tetratricopeptide repeat protein [Flavobacterium agri]NUY80842.1 tetratricopeptide repeat protein [Flavobacterium agri]NYA70866.1 tetratricopeptide repeat protein [Flavobacterium agri]
MKQNLLAFLLFICTLASAQSVDSLVAQLPKSKNDIDRADLLNAVSDGYKTSDASKVTEYAGKALDLSRRIKYKTAEGNALLNLGTAGILTGNYPKALEYFTSAQTLFENEYSANPKDVKVKAGLAKAYGSIGIVFSEQSNYARALQFHLKAAPLYETMDEPLRLGRVYNNIGIVYQSLHNDFKALEYFVKAQKIQEKSADPTVGITATNIGNIYLGQKNFAKAFEYYSKARNMFTGFPNPRGLGELLNNLGSYYQQTGNTLKARETWDEAIKVFNSIEDKFGTADTYAHLAKYYFSADNLDESLNYANRSLALAKELDIPEQVVIAEKMLSDIYTKKNDPKMALLHFQNYSIAKDSLNINENIRKSVQAEMNYEFDKREALQKKEREKRELLFSEQSKRHIMQTFFIVLFILLLFGIVFLIYNRLQLKKTLTLEKELAEYEQKALHLQMNPHFVFNCLGSISSFIVQNGTDSAIKYLSKFSKLMRLTLEYSKESLIPIDKEIEGLRNYLELEQLRFNQIFEFSINKSSDIEDDTALPPLLLQPFVENAIIHGLVPKKGQGRIDISFELSGDNLICTIVDDGIGIDKSRQMKEQSVSVHKSMALDITKKRLEMIKAFTSRKADVDITERADNEGHVIGTQVVLTLPVQYINDK